MPWSQRELLTRKWVLDHPGVCKSIADTCKVSAEYVRQVLYGKRGSGGGKGSTPTMQKIIRILKSKGAPIA